MGQGQTREIRISLPEELFAFFLPEKTVGHVVRAKREMLLALRSLIDARIEALDRMEKKRSEKKRTEKKKIKIE